MCRSVSLRCSRINIVSFYITRTSILTRTGNNRSEKNYVGYTEGKERGFFHSLLLRRGTI